ncbi:CCCH zinc finger protein [Aspergillus clavatus NRRL 1]|uniref:CCCH zinc finger protein n=1 Tax=Aspergillus clavatus (strain ATCC 1007 / CBS 513.65 / DSM 816 / NCTC 3887 / NRRL 1 / QM 1276 / 107) TaxID=344612 RepID=A1C3X5_ASPCL|nr:CCCH zinc finger protein [Aspergillus clavatus NRRL 1]EAW15115.1 CCCH zinc finger protein [Aspergillus clavatus NRRL 1]
MPLPQMSGYQHPSNASSFPSPQQFSQPSTALGSPYQRQASYDASYASPNVQSTAAYHSLGSPNQHATQSMQTPMMGPPIRWGFDASSSAQSFSGSQRGNQRAPRQFNAYGNQPSFGEAPTKHGAKRDRASAFGGKPQPVAPRVPAPPAVPSFGNPLPVKPPPAADNAPKPKKKKRKHNQLGLTPKTEEHESSEEEDDVDEESRLAPAGAGAAAPLRFTYRGRTTTLQSPEDIAAWIEERKKRYPTRARIEEKKKALEEARKAREEALRQKQAERQEQRRLQKDAAKPSDRPSNLTDPDDKVAKAKRKAEKLQLRLMKEQKRVAKAEAEAERARLRVEELQKGTMDVGKESTIQEVKSENVIETKTDAALCQQLQQSAARTEQPDTSIDPDQGLALADGVAVPIAVETKPEPGDLVDFQEKNSAMSPSDTSDSSDWTSSSGSDDSDSDSDESDNDSAPEEISSRREGPERVPPPPRANKKNPCHQFARYGRCSRGDNCQYSHETSGRGPKQKPIEKKGRKGLFQALVERQKDEEDRRTMDVIMWLGENGFLNAPEATEAIQNPTPVETGTEN